jgi:hypothetical protein
MFITYLRIIIEGWGSHSYHRRRQGITDVSQNDAAVGEENEVTSAIE